MDVPIDIRVERLKRLRRDDSDTWQGAFVRMPSWVDEEGGPPYRPLLPVWQSGTTGLVQFGELMRPEKVERSAAIDALVTFSLAEGIKYRPAAVEVSDPLLADFLRERLSPAQIEVRLAERTDRIDALLEELAQRTVGPFAISSSLEAAGGDENLLRSFAEAAAEFYRAAPWNHLIDEDLIRVVSEVPDDGLSWLSVLGAAGQTYGIGFYASRRDYELLASGVSPEIYFRERGSWSLTFGPIMEMSFPDSDLWLDRSFPVAGDDAYPLLLYYSSSGGFRRPDVAVLRFVDGLLRMLAVSTEDELDSGRWGKSVQTGSGSSRIELAIPSLLESPAPGATATSSAAARHPDPRLSERSLFDLQSILAEKEFASVDDVNEFLGAHLGRGEVPRQESMTLAQRARDLFYQALETTGRMRVRLARRAIQTWPDCADAFVLLAEAMPDLDRRLGLYSQAMEAGQRALAEESLRAGVGNLWGRLEARPYMRARAGYAGCLEALGRREEAVDHWQDLLRLNLNDNQALRYRLIPALLELGRDEEALRLLERFDDEGSAIIRYCRALLEFRRAGDAPSARGRLANALQANAHVPKYLLGRKTIPPRLPEVFSYGGEDEAVLCVLEIRDAWKRSRGALTWLGRFLRRPRKAPRRNPRTDRHPG